jgi:hypothetical protein
MSEKNLPFTPQLLKPPRLLLIHFFPFATWVLMVASFCVYGAMLLTQEDARHRYDDVRTGATGLVRSPERWSDPNTVSYRSWEADSVIVAVASKTVAFNRPAVGTRCYVHGATVVVVESRDQSDVLLTIRGHADHRDGSDLNTEEPDGFIVTEGFIVDVSQSDAVREVGDCPDGTMFIASLDEALRMIQNEHTRETRWESDGPLLREHARNAARAYDTR